MHLSEVATLIPAPLPPPPSQPTCRVLLPKGVIQPSVRSVGFQQCKRREEDKEKMRVAMGQRHGIQLCFYRDKSKMNQTRQKTGRKAWSGDGEGLSCRVTRMCDCVWWG